MRLATLRTDTRTLLVFEDEGALWHPQAEAGWPATLLEFIQAGPALWRSFNITRLRERARRYAPDAVEWLAPIPRPVKNVLCLGLNYRDHAEESARAKGLPVKLPTDAVVFTKAVTTVTGPFADVPAHTGVTKELDWEVELGVIIGTGGRGIARHRALDHVFGYTVINDVSARDLQFRHSQFFLGKSLDGHCPMGPVVVTADEIPDPQNLALQCRVNGAVKQNGHTRDMIFDVATTIEILSRGMTLEPGDIISTGTPAGVGFARTPPEYLQPGDVVECEIEKIGRLRNRVSG